MLRGRSRKKEAATYVDQVTSYFNEAAEHYFLRYRENSMTGYGFQIRKKTVLELIDKPGGSVLDVGCGPGIMVCDLVSRGFEFWGVDISPIMIDQCGRNFGKVERAHFSVGNATALDFPDAFFDVVVCIGVIERIEKYESALREMCRVLKAGGVCIISFPNLYSPNEAWRKFVYNPTVDRMKLLYSRLTHSPKPLPLCSFVRLHRESSSCRMIKRYFEEITNAVYYNFNVFLSPLDHLLPRTALWAALKLEIHSTGRLRWLGTGFIIKAIKRV